MCRLVSDQSSFVPYYDGITASCSSAYLFFLPPHHHPPLREIALHFSPLTLFLYYCQVISNSTAFMPVQVMYLSLLTCDYRFQSPEPAA